MPDKQYHIPNPENPEGFTGLHLGKIKTAAAGIPAVVSSFKMILSEAGFFRGNKALLNLNQKGGFDCPSCAWPDPDDERSGIAEYCENGARAVAEEATTKRLTASFFRDHSVFELSQLSDFEIGKKGRLAEPMYIPKGGTHYEPISWKEAFFKIGMHLKSLDSPDEAVFYTSGRTSNEAAFLYQLFVREYGTNNLPDCSNMCHESSGVALSESLGIGKGSVKLEDFYDAEVILIIGQNPGTNHPRMLSALQKAKKKGAIIISINPLPETGLMGFNNPQEINGILGINSALTDLFLQVKINGDLALIQAIEKILVTEEMEHPGTVLDLDFIEKHCLNYVTFLKNILSVDIAVHAEQSGISIDQIQEAANLLKHKKKIIACWAMGLTQHKNAVETIKEVVNLLLLKGSIGKPGAGTCPVRGHSNVQGDRTMGIYEKPSKKFLQSIESQFGFKPPEKHGYDVVECIKAMHEEKAKVFVAMGGNFLSATPDTLFTAAALRKCKLTVQISTKLNRSHLIHGEEALILPCLGRSDKDMINGINQSVTCENSMGVVQASKGVVKPVSNKLLSEPVIVGRLARAALDARSKVDWERYAQHYDAIRDAIEKTIPGFENYNERAFEPGGFYLPNCNREGWFDTLSGKAHFNIATPEQRHLAKGEFMMMTIRSHDQFNTTIYGLNDRYRGIYNERRVILMNQVDMNQSALAAGDVVDLFSNFGDVERVANHFIVMPFPIPKSCTATYFPETNVLVPIDSVADKSNTPTSKMIIITLRKHQASQVGEASV
jgi:molybdopterin-dependent oxidoreductase alpha subunit